MIEKTKFTYYPLGKAFFFRKKTIADQERKQAEALKVLKLDVQQLKIRDVISKDQLNE